MLVINKHPLMMFRLLWMPICAYPIIRVKQLRALLHQAETTCRTRATLCAPRTSKTTTKPVITTVLPDPTEPTRGTPQHSCALPGVRRRLSKSVITKCRRTPLKQCAELVGTAARSQVLGDNVPNTRDMSHPAEPTLCCYDCQHG